MVQRDRCVDGLDPISSNNKWVCPLIDRQDTGEYISPLWSYYFLRENHTIGGQTYPGYYVWKDVWAFDDIPGYPGIKDIQVSRFYLSTTLWVEQDTGNSYELADPPYNEERLAWNNAYCASGDPPGTPIYDDDDMHDRLDADVRDSVGLLVAVLVVMAVGIIVVWLRRAG